MNTQTTVSQGRDKQWTARSYVQLPIANENRQLKVSTWKSSRGTLYTSCQCVKMDGMCESFMMYGDFNKTIKTFPEIKRVNEKVVRQAHDVAMLEIDNVIKEAMEFYTTGEGKAVIELTNTVNAVAI